jgi:hypothetical protein
MKDLNHFRTLALRAAIAAALGRPPTHGAGGTCRR